LVDGFLQEFKNKKNVQSEPYPNNQCLGFDGNIELLHNQNGQGCEDGGESFIMEELEIHLK
jgi:hypothetical protein